jgi:hypothetical protein
MMFKTQIRLIDETWNDIDVYKSRIRPQVGEYIYLESHQSYFTVKNILHSVRPLVYKYEFICVVEKVENPNLIEKK